MRPLARAVLALSLAFVPRPGRAAEVTNLPLGDPARRDREAPLVVDAVTDTATGALLTPREVAARLGPVRILFVGESHTSMAFHDAQRRILEELHRAGRKVLVGLEMYPYTEQGWLDRWSKGELSEAAFVKDAHWYRNWGYHWNYYRDIFLFARDNGLRMFGVNTPREVVSAVFRKGLANLSPEEAARIPSRIDTDSAEHRTLFRAFFAEEGGIHSSGMSDEQLDAMYRAQCTWDATMGKNAVEALKAYGDPDAIMVVLIGSGHVAYGLGAERQARLWFDGKMASLVPVPVRDEKGREAHVRASYADFVWTIPPEADPLYPSLGLSQAEGKGSEPAPVIDVAKDSVAAAAGFLAGDVVLAVDGAPVPDKETFNRLLSEKRWGDSAVFRVRRGEGTVDLTARFRRRPPAKP